MIDTNPSFLAWRLPYAQATYPCSRSHISTRRCVDRAFCLWRRRQRSHNFSVSVRRNNGEAFANRIDGDDITGRWFDHGQLHGRSFQQRHPWQDDPCECSGVTLYRYDRDSAGTSNCTGSCATAWPPLAAAGTLNAGSGVTGTLATISRADGSKQVTYNGMPLYTFEQDAKTGDATGDGVNSFHVVTP